MNKLPIEVGSVVISKAGRDAGRLFIVVEALKEQLANGEPIENQEVRSWLSKEEEKLVQV